MPLAAHARFADFLLPWEEAPPACLHPAMPEHKNLVTIFGAGGGVGAHCVRQASSRGLLVRAVVRTPEKVIFFQGLPGVSLVKGDVTDHASVEAALRGASFCVFTASGRKPTPARDVDHLGMAAVAKVCAASDIKLVVVSSIYVSAKNRFHPIRALLNVVVRWGVMDAKLAGETDVRALPGLRYTILRPSGLTDGPPSALQWQVAQGDSPWFGRYSISRQDVATVCLAALQDPACDRVTLEIQGADPKNPDDKPVSVQGMFDGLSRD
jgi:uncharacterized protein YbjT (DUF2867 family)